MKIIFTKHVYDKLIILEKLGWKVTEDQIKQTIESPKWHGASRHGQATVMGLLTEDHILRVIFNTENGKIKVVTVHVARRGRYESTL